MTLLPQWLPELTLRTLRVIVIGFILLNSWSIHKAYNEIINPLIPKSLSPYVAFPHYFFIAFYIGVIFMIWKFLKGDVGSKHWWIPVAIVFLFEFFKFFIYGFLMWVNPFG